jgi:tetratricopeptide (TPR) repeat protein
VSPLRSHHTSALLACFALVHAPSAAYAQSAAPVAPPTDRAAEADALVQQGVAQRRAGQDQLALESFRRAFAITPAARTQAQIALAEQALGQWSDADRDLRAALAATSDEWIQRNRSALEAALNSIASRIATIELSCTTPGARLFVNGRETGTFPLDQPLRVETGTVALEVRLDGYRTVRRAIDVEGGRGYRESFTLVQNVVEPPDEGGNTGNTGNGGTRNNGAARVVTPPPEPPAPPLSWALIGASAGLVGVGIIGHVYWQNRVALYNSDVELLGEGEYEPGCFYSTPEYPRRADRCGAILSESWAGFGLAVTGYALGAAALGAGLYVRFTSRPATPAAERSTGAASARIEPSWTCAPTLGLSGAQCLVRF